MTSRKQRKTIRNDEDDNITNSDKSFSDTDEIKYLDLSDVKSDNFPDSSKLLNKTYERSYLKINEMKSKKEGKTEIYYKGEFFYDDGKRKVFRNFIFNSINKVKETYTYTSLIKFLITLMLFAIVVYIFYLRNKKEEESYENKFHDLKDRFKLENQLSWKLLNNSLSKQLFKETEFLERPAVIILVGTKEKSDSFLMRLEILISVRSQCRSWQPLKIDSTVPSSQQQEQLKSLMLEFLHETHKDGFHCVKMGDIDQIPPALGPILHGLTDEYNAPYKDMIYLFSLVVGDRNDDQSLNMRKLDEMFVVDVLRRYWVSEMGEERFQALITRVAGTVVGIK